MRFALFALLLASCANKQAPDPQTKPYCQLMYQVADQADPHAFKTYLFANFYDKRLSAVTCNDVRDAQQKQAVFAKYFCSCTPEAQQL